MKYNYVIFGSKAEFWKIAYKDVSDRSDVLYISKRIATKSRLIYNFYRFTVSSLFKGLAEKNRYLWRRKAFKNPFKDKKPLCFLFFAGSEWYTEKYINYLRKKYPDCKVVEYYQDLVAKTKADETLYKKCDLALSYDKSDAEKYGMTLYQDVYSEIKVEDDKNIEYSDGYFVGKGKDRLDTIYAVYERLKNLGLKCDFYLADVPAEKRRFIGEISYGKVMPYSETLKHVVKTKAILEILQGGSNGYTFRTGEAIVYGKKLITNNQGVTEEPFYHPELIKVFSRPEDITAEFVRNATEKTYGYKEEISPERLLEFIDKTLQ